MDEASIFVKGDISLGGCTDLHHFPRGSVNVHTCKDDIHDTFVSPNAGQQVMFSYYRINRDRKVLALGMVDAYLEQEIIQCEQWLA